MDAAARLADCATGRDGWRLAVSLGISLAVHCAALGFPGLSGFSQIAARDGRPLQLTARLVPGVPGSRPVAAAAIADGAIHRPESAPPGKQEPSPPPLGLATAAVNGLIPGPWYYPARYLHRRPTVLKPIRPTYPPEAETISGQVQLLLLINESGGVDSYHIVESQPPGIFDNTVIDAFARERYAPGLITGYPVKSQLLVEVVFEPGTAPQASLLPALPRQGIQQPLR